MLFRSILNQRATASLGQIRSLRAADMDAFGADKAVNMRNVGTMA